MQCYRNRAIYAGRGRDRVLQHALNQFEIDTNKK